MKFATALRRHFTLFLCWACVCGTASVQAAPGFIVVGQAIDLSGPDSALGRDYVAGIKTYFDTVNAAGGINGKKIKYIVRDDQGQADLAAKQVTELLEHSQADFIFGGVGDSNAQAILDSEAFKRSGQILYAPLAGSNRIVDAHALFWRPSYQQEIRHIFEHFAKLGMRDVGVVIQDSTDSVDAMTGIQAEIKNRGLRLIGSARIGRNGEKAAAEAARLASTKPGFVVVIADTIGTGLFLKEFRKFDARTFVAGTSLTNLSTLNELAGSKAVEWTVFSQVVPNPGSSATVIQMEHLNMMRKYRDESVSALTLEGFAAAKAWGKIVQQSHHPRTALHDLIAQNGGLDLGGLQIVCSPNNNRLSAYLDIALFKKGNELVF